MKQRLLRACTITERSIYQRVGECLGTLRRSKLPTNSSDEAKLTDHADCPRFFLRLHLIRSRHLPHPQLISRRPRRPQRIRICNRHRHHRNPTPATCRSRRHLDATFPTRTAILFLCLKAQRVTAGMRLAIGTMARSSDTDRYNSARCKQGLVYAYKMDSDGRPCLHCGHPRFARNGTIICCAQLSPIERAGPCGSVPAATSEPLCREC